MDQRIINLFDEYTHKPLSRQAFLKKLVQLTGSTAAALSVLPLLEVNYAHAQTIEDGQLFTELVTYSGVEGEMNAYVARPKKKKKYPVVMVIHENRGLNPHIEDVTRRLAFEGFLAIAPDALSAQGGTPADADKARELFGKLDAAKNLNNFIKGFEYTKTRKDASTKWGCIGFCWGGALANQLAVNMPDLKVAVPFYGRQPEAADVPKIKAFVQAHYGGLDERINAGIPAYETALKAAGTRYEIFVYEGAQHAFNNDTAPTRYNEVAAKLAWSRAIALFKKELV
ncbi:MAG: dienelactone hydrolase family protein [Cytophagales bacterium]|nr:dienelactone hydrolase family protein [Cytophagales bacterium]MCA6368507.1 dienelactone hydrolase family protein [Cytophagales bacterium]MCA6370453.1 dienelactone hydrolase family protein [Cytophagales bacterium]MCA6377338.1 dienelactone hydrolase family protein [Cytophagales bacterium]MCA6384324.1 dienelactone hydrolase family protein [Cytophagales bacterium]